MNPKCFKCCGEVNESNPSFQLTEDTNPDKVLHIHRKCFECSMCTQTLSLSNYITVNAGNLVCKFCFQKYFPTPQSVLIPAEQTPSTDRPQLNANVFAHTRDHLRDPLIETEVKSETKKERKEEPLTYFDLKPVPPTSLPMVANQASLYQQLVHQYGMSQPQMNVPFMMPQTQLQSPFMMSQQNGIGEYLMQQYQQQHQQADSYLSSNSPSSSMYSSPEQQQQRQHGVFPTSPDQRQTVVQTTNNNNGGTPYTMAQITYSVPMMFPQQCIDKKTVAPQSPESDPLSLQPQSGQTKKRRKSSKPSSRNRTTITEGQREILMNVYSRTSFPNNKERRELGIQTGLCARQVQVWFQNMRRKEKASSGAPRKDNRGRKPKALNLDLDSTNETAKSL